MFTKEYLEKQIKKNGSLTVYTPSNVPLTITHEHYIGVVGNDRLEFNMDCDDLEEYCVRLGLSLAPNKN